MSDDSEESLNLEDSASSDGDSILSDESSPPVTKKQRTTKGSPAPKAAAKKGSPTPKRSTSDTKAKPVKGSAKPTAQATPAAKPVTNAGASVEVAPKANDSAAVGDITRGPPITTDIAARKLIAQYLRQQNRPYSALQIHDNLHKRIQKGTIERVLTSMCQPDGGFICKEYGKAKIYFVDQSTLPSDFTADQLDALQAQNEDLKRQVEEASAEDRRVKEELHQLQAEPADADLDRLLQEARERVAEKRERVARLSNKGGSASGGGGSSSRAGSGTATGDLRYKTLAGTVQAHNFFRKAWAARRLQCLEAVDLLSEGLGKKAKDVMVSGSPPLGGAVCSPA